VRLLFLLPLAAGACARPAREHARAAPDTSAARAIALDRPQQPLVPLAGAFRLDRFSVERTALDRATPVPASPRTPPVNVAPAEPSPEPDPASPGTPPEPGEPSARAPRESTSPDERVLLPPIPRGAPAIVAAGRGGRVTLDVRIDEQGDVSDALLVTSDADSLVVQAAIEAAFGLRYHPALLGGTPTAVWTRQVIDVRRAGAHARP
jgi:hypothetical protein